MPSLLLLAPVALLITAGLANAVIGLAGWKIGRLSAAAGPWAALAVVIAEWAPFRATQEMSVGALGYGTRFDLRLDAVVFVFVLLILVPSAILLTVQPRAWQESTAAVLGVAAAVLAVEAGNVLFTALAGGTAATLAVLQLDMENIKAPRPSWGMLLAAWLALAWAGVILQVRGGTDSYVAVPESALTPAVFGLLALSAVMASGLIPWFGWPRHLWSRPSLRSAGMVLATLHPLGFYLLVRAYEMGAGAYPNAAFNVGLSALGLLVAIAAAVRSQAATTRRDYLGDVIPGLAGFALMALGLGSPLGLVGAIALLCAAALVTAYLPLLPDRTSRPVPILAIAAAVGVPPGLAFGARLLGLQAAFESGELLGLIGVAGAAVWLLSAAAAARAIRLPAGRPRGPDAGTLTDVGVSTPAVVALSGALVAAGPALALLVNTLALPATNAVMTVPPGVLAGGSVAVDSVASVLPAVALLTPVLLLVVAGLVIAERAAGARAAGPTPPLLPVPTGAAAALASRARSLTIPDQYRSLLDLRALEATASRGRPLFWLAVVAALVIAVNR